MTSISRHTEITLVSLLKGFAVDLSLPDMQITGLTSNSLKVKKGDLFVAQAGLTRHAIDFATDAVNSGAVAVIYDADDLYCLQRIPLLEKQNSVPFIAVADLQQKAGEIASRFYANPTQNFKLIGITGTDGKTSVTHLLVQALNKLHKVAGSVGTLGYGLSNQLKMTQYTTPDAIALQSILFELSLGGCEYVAMEVSSHALDQYRVSGCQFDIAVLTNLGSDHLDYHVDQESYRAAKLRLFEKQGLSGRVLNIDDEFGQSLAAIFKGNKVVRYTADTANKVQAEVKLHSSCMTAQGIKIIVSIPTGQVEIQTGLIGDFNVENLLSCLSTLLLLGFDRQKIEHSMQGLQPIPGRMEYLPSVNHKAAAVIDFAHTEQALSACLNSLKNYSEGKLICIFGCGGDRDRSKRAKMAAVAEQLADQVIVTDDNPRNESPEQIIRDILSGFINPERVRIIHDRQTAIETAMAEASEKDLVVIAGKGHEQIQIVGEQKLPFSDRYIVRQSHERLDI